MITAGLTGSIGMGKSTTAKMFQEAGIPVHDADATVHALYSGDAAELIEVAFPGTVKDGTVDRAKLGPMVVGNKEAMKKLEEIVHPLVAKERDKFLEQHQNEGAKLVILDIPLLFETGGDALVDKVIVVTASPETQRQRVLAREGMTEEKFKAILAKQVPDAQKRERADYVIDTDYGMEPARRRVAEIIADITGSAQ